MFKSPFLIFFFLGAAFAQNSAWSQCGSPTWSGSTECVTGYSCYIQNYYYSQCRPIGDCPSNWNCSIFIAPEIKNNSLPDWSQCGGPNWSSSSICTANSQCYVQNYYFSQCRPIGDCPSNWNCSIFIGPSDNNNNGLPAWSQCGGQNWIGRSNCVTGYFCYIQDYYYAQCRPVGDCPSNWNCSINGLSSTTSSSSSIYLTTISSSKLSTTSTNYNSSCLPTEYWSASRKICLPKGGYGIRCKLEPYCNGAVGLFCKKHKYYCDCPLVYVNVYYCDCNILNYYSYSNKKCVPKKAYKSKCSKSYECNNISGLKCRSNHCLCSKGFWNGKKCVAVCPKGSLNGMCKS